MASFAAAATCLLLGCAGAVRVPVGVDSLGAAAPREPGCYLMLPSGCRGHTLHARTFWRKTEDTDEKECRLRAPERYNSWCGTDDARTAFVPLAKHDARASLIGGLHGAQVTHGHGLAPAAAALPMGDTKVTVEDLLLERLLPPLAAGRPEGPTAPGCYVHLPDGCHRQKFHAMRAWRRAPYDQVHECTGWGKKRYDEWCGVDNAEMLWVAPTARA